MVDALWRRCGGKWVGGHRLWRLMWAPVTGGDKQPPTRASPIIPSVHRSHQSIPGADRTDRRLRALHDESRGVPERAANSEGRSVT